MPVVTGLVVSQQLPYMTDKLLRNEIFRFSRIADVPDEAKLDKEYLLKNGPASGLVIPMRVGGDVIGAFAFGSFSYEMSWPGRVVKRAQLLGEIFANALVRQKADRELQAAFSEISTLKERLEQENIYLREEIELRHEHKEIVGGSEAINAVLKQAEDVAPTDSTVLILGETGTGKELLAQAIHRLSDRKNRTMVRVSCASLPATLVESELFGREKGAYTGALTREVGRFEIADGSTIFLDEIGEMPLETQAKLLTVLEEGRFERLGSPKTIEVDIRAIAASNRDLEQAVREGRFREDLYYRLNVFPITVPPLLKRKEDIPLLVWAFVKEYQETMGKAIDTISRSHMERLKQCPWPGTSGSYGT